VVQELSGHSKGKLSCFQRSFPFNYSFHLSIAIYCCEWRGNLVASGSVDKMVKAWDIRDGSCVRILEGHTEEVTALHLDPDASDDRLARFFSFLPPLHLAILSVEYSLFFLLFLAGLVI